MTPRERPDYLRPLPGPAETATAPETEADTPGPPELPPDPAANGSPPAAQTDRPPQPYPPVPPKPQAPEAPAAPDAPPAPEAPPAQQAPAPPREDPPPPPAPSRPPKTSPVPRRPDRAPVPEPPINPEPPPADGPAETVETGAGGNGAGGGMAPSVPPAPPRTQPSPAQPPAAELPAVPVQVDVPDDAEEPTTPVERKPVERTADGEIPGLIPPMSRGHSGAFITDAVLDLGYATPEQIEQAVGQSRTAGRSPEQLLLEQGIIDPEQLTRAVAERYGLDFVDLAVFQVDMGAANLISVKSARRHQAVPIGFIDESTLLLAMADPANVARPRRRADGDRAELPGRRRARRRHRVPDREADHPAEHRRRGHRRGRGGRGAGRGRDHRHPRLGRGRAGDQARQQHPRTGRIRGRLGHPLRAARSRRCGSASASTACSRRRPGSRSGWSPGSSRGSRS